MYFRYFLNDFEMVQFARISTATTFVLTYHMRCIAIAGSLNFTIFSTSFMITFLSPVIALSIKKRVPFSLARIMTYSLALLLLLLLLLLLFILFYFILFYFVLRNDVEFANR